MKLTIKKSNGNESGNASKKQVNNRKSSERSAENLSSNAESRVRSTKVNPKSAPKAAPKTDKVTVVPASTVPASVPAEAVEVSSIANAPIKPARITNAAEPKAKPKAEPKGGYTIQSYQTKKGGTAYLLYGFETLEQAQAVAEKCSKTVSATWRYNDKGEKRFCLSFGSRYGDVVKAMTSALNKGDQKAVDKACTASSDVYTLAVAAGKAEREAKAAERKAAKEAEKAEKAAKGYSDKEVAAMLSKIMAGGDIPESVRKHMKLAKAA